MSKTVLSFKENDIEKLKDIIKNIATSHSQVIKEAKDDLPSKHEFDIRKISRSVILLEQFKALDQTILNEVIETLEDSVRNILDSSILVEDRGIKKLVPLPYEILSLIFISTNEKFRQHFFYEVMEYYYTELSENLKNISATKVLEKEDFEQQVKVLLPIVKLETINKLLQKNDLKSQQLLKEIISNIILFFKYQRLNQEDVLISVSNKLNSKNYDLLSYELIALDERNGYLGDYFKLKATVKLENTEKTFSLFAKFLTPKLEVMRKKIPLLSKKENFFTMVYLPLLKEHGLEPLLDFTPECHLYRLNDVIIMDDMASLGFTSLALNTKLEDDSLTSAIKQLAKLHACSILLEEILSKQAGKTITLLDLYKDYVFEIVVDRNNIILKDRFNSFKDNVLHLVDKFPEFTKNIAIDEFKKAITGSWEILFERIKKSDKFRNAICHGDMHIGNVLFKYDGEKICRDASLIDWQTYRYCPPVHDVLFFIQQNSLKDVRDKHYRQLLDLYYTELSKHFKNLNFDIGKIYSKEEFEESIKYMKPQVVLHAILYSEFNCIEPHLREEIFQSEELSHKYLHAEPTAFIELGMKDEKYRQVLGGLIRDLVEQYESGSL